jgi:hypothetical protein
MMILPSFPRQSGKQCLPESLQQGSLKDITRCKKNNGLKNAKRF